MRQKTVTEKYRAVLEGKMAKSEFVRQMRQQYPMHVTQFNGFDDSVQILKNRGLLFEAQAEKKAKVYDERPSLPYSDDAFQRGIRYELEAAGIAAHDAFNIKLDDFDKAKKKAEDNLMKDPMHYLNLISGESSKVDKHDKEVPVKRGEGKVDVFNGLKKANLRESLQEGNYEKLAKDLNTTPEKIKAAIEKLRAGEKDQIEKDATKKAFGEEVVKSHPDEIEDATFPVADAFEKVGIDMSKDVHVHYTDGGPPGLGAGQLKDKGLQSAESVVKMLEAKRLKEIEQYEEDKKDAEYEMEYPVMYEYFYYGGEKFIPEGKEFKLTFSKFEGESYDIFQESSNMNEEDDIPFKKVYQADFDELKKFLLNKTNASHDAHVLDGVFHELFESAENLVDEQPGTSEIDAIFAVAENMVENYEEDGQEEEAAIAQDVFNIIKPIAMASENTAEAASGLEEVMVAALRKGYNEEQIVDAVNKIRNRKKGDGPDMDSIAQHTQFYNKEEVETNEASQEESVADYIIKHYTNPKTGKSLVDDEIVSDFFKTHPEWEQQADGTDDGMKELIRNFGEYLDANYEGASDMREVEEGKTIDVYGDGDVVVDISRATPEQERLINYEFEISEFGDSEEAQEVADQIMNLNSADDVENYYANERGWDEDDDMRSDVRTAVDVFRGLEEKKGKDHDGDGDIDGDDYMAAKDKAIKKAMGKEEQLKEAIKKIIKESLLKEAATAKLSDIGDKYGDYKGMQVVINDLENIVTDMEGYFAKTRERVQSAMDKIGQVETPDGMKVGAFLAPAIETAFFKDLNPVRKLSPRDIKLPQVKVAKFDDLQREAEAGIAPKETVFGVNEKK